MKYIYLILLLSFSLFANAQAGKGIDAHPELMSVKAVKFYPNPATTVIHFELLDRSERGYTLQIYNFVGKKVFEAVEIAHKTTIPLNDYFRGVYIYQLRDRTGKVVESGKFQVK
ncbi:T9SS type A sorting domain-containing protein [Aridibaculum aurantiacum]|uniref:T9SS type A sorting domain-containing protein n=1 Tax=Aridibaculum aurantiacum TaxID=2810307 RepID=UPI001A95861D|nr:T9SS type A sorting domain-containing protein [Aridibaculum aurantiacum]